MKPSIFAACYRIRPGVLLAGLAFCLATSLPAQTAGTPHVPVLPLSLASFPSSLLLPPTGTLDCPQEIRFAGPAGSAPVQLRDLRLAPPAALQAPPAAGTTVVQSYGTGARARVCLDGSDSFQALEMSAAVQVRVSAVTDSDGSLHYDTELLQLDLSGGSLPSGMRLRESPTLQSTGTTKIRKIDSSNAYRIDSFFDVFLELSSDGGQSWRPAVAVAACGLSAPSVEVVCATPTLPPSGSVHRCATAMSFDNGAVIRNLALRNPATPLPPPPPGGSQTVSTSATVTAELSLDGGVSFTSCTAVCDLTERVSSLFDDGTARYFDTELLALNLSGGTLPGGVMVRESPTKQSMGRSSLRLAPDQQYRISSFFDIFTEISLDGGNSWRRCASGACSCALAPESPAHFFTNASFPLPADYACDGDASVSFGSTGVVISELSFRPSATRSPLPAAGAAVTVALGGSVSGTLAKDGKISFFPYTLTNTGNASDAFVLSSSSSGECSMECLSLSFTTGGPSPLMLRESPSKGSLGRTVVRSVASSSGTQASGCMISSFFDVFLELSSDGGQTWTPADSALHLALRPYAEQQNIFASACLPPRDGSFAMGMLESPLDCPNGVLVRNLRLDSFASSQPLPGDGQAQTQAVACNASCEVSSDYGGTWTRVISLVSLPIVVTPVAQASAGPAAGPPQRVFQIAVPALDLSGGTLPGGMMLRESPTKQSMGRCIAQRLSDGSACRIDGFFDVWIEVSLDGGQTWSPASTAAHLPLRALPPACFSRCDWLPVALDYRAPDSEFVCLAGQAGIRAFALGAQGLSRDIQVHPNFSTPSDCLFSAPVRFDLTLDGGTTVQSVACDASLACRFTGSGDSSGSRMTQECSRFDLSGGTLPPAMRLRESPTLASTGKTTVRATDGGYQISSFFDIFTELSLDGGATWTPLCSPLHLECCDTPQVFLAPASKLVSFERLTVPPAGLSPQCAASVHLNFTKIEYKRSPAPAAMLPAPGQTLTLADSGSADFLYAADDGLASTPIHCDAFCRYALKLGNLSDADSVYDTEMLQFEFSGGNLPVGMKLRESPSLPSHGKLRLRESPTEPSRVSSFFDVFMELSLDGGMSWQPFDLPFHFQAEIPPLTSSLPDNSWPPPGQFSLWPANGDLDFSTAFANGAVMSFFDIFTQLGTTRPQLPTTVAEFVDCSSAERCHFRLNPTAASPALDVDCAAACTVRLTCAGSDSSGACYFDTEMLQLDLTGNELPPGMRLRESPSKQSLGKHTVRVAATDGTGGGSVVDSFFDVFLELSTDAGKSWSPAAAPVRLEFLAPAMSVTNQNDATLVSGVSSEPFGPVLTTDSGVVRAFTVHNSGTADIAGVSVLIDGPDAAAFTLAKPPATSVPARSSISFAVIYSSTSTGPQTATLHVLCQTPGMSPFDITLSGRSLLPDADDDGDGLSNKDELALAAFGLDPLADNSAAIQALRASGFFRSSDMHALALGRPVLARDASSGHFHLQLGLRESPTLQSWSALTKFSATCNPATGLLDIDIAPETGGAMFYQVFGAAP